MICLNFLLKCCRFQIIDNLTEERNLRWIILIKAVFILIKNLYLKH